MTVNSEENDLWQVYVASCLPALQCRMIKYENALAHS